jgi:hypothetical protein
MTNTLTQKRIKFSITRFPAAQLSWWFSTKISSPDNTRKRSSAVLKRSPNQHSLISLPRNLQATHIQHPAFHEVTSTKYSVNYAFS